MVSLCEPASTRSQFTSHNTLFFWLKGLILILIKHSINREHYKLATEANVLATSLISDRPFTSEASILTKSTEGGASKITKSSLRVSTSGSYIHLILPFQKATLSIIPYHFTIHPTSQNSIILPFY